MINRRDFGRLFATAAAWIMDPLSTRGRDAQARVVSSGRVGDAVDTGYVDRVAQRIRSGIADLNSGANGSDSWDQQITPSNAVEFLHHPRGLALCFWAMSMESGTPDAPPYLAEEDEWRRRNRIRHSPEWAVIDCHTHYIDILRPDGSHNGRQGTHRADQYRHGAHHHWWLFPETYHFDNSFNAALLSPTLHHHDGAHYKQYMAESYRLLGGRLRFLAVPAPYDSLDPGSALDGVNDTASYKNMADTCDALNLQLGATVCHPVGAIKNVGGHRVPDEHDEVVYKLYPRPNWTTDNAGFFQNVLPASLSDLNQPGKGHTVLIHWWDGDQAAAIAQIESLAQSCPHINFVVYHAAFPNHCELAPLLKRNANLFAEIGGVFANQVFGMSGADVDVATSRPCDLGDLRGVAAAVEYIQVLRGVVSNGIGENDHKILWGTDAVWHGLPLWQVEAFKRLRLTPDAGKDAVFKRKVLGENSRVAFSAFAFGPPLGVNAARQGSTNVIEISWLPTAGATAYETIRRNGTEWVSIGVTAGSSQVDLTVPDTMPQVYAVRSLRASEPASPFSAAAVASTFNYASILPGGIIRASHLVELRTLINGLRANVGLNPFSFADASLHMIKAIHIRELRTALEEAFAPVGITVPSYSQPDITPGVTKVKAADLLEIQQALQ